MQRRRLALPHGQSSSSPSCSTASRSPTLSLSRRGRSRSAGTPVKVVIAPACTHPSPAACSTSLASTRTDPPGLLAAAALARALPPWSSLRGTASTSRPPPALGTFIARARSQGRLRRLHEHRARHRRCSCPPARRQRASALDVVNSDGVEDRKPASAIHGLFAAARLPGRRHCPRPAQDTSRRLQRRQRRALPLLPIALKTGAISCSAADPISSAPSPLLGAAYTALSTSPPPTGTKIASYMRSLSSSRLRHRPRTQSSSRTLSSPRSAPASRDARTMAPTSRA